MAQTLQSNFILSSLVSSYIQTHGSHVSIDSPHKDGYLILNTKQSLFRFFFHILQNSKAMGNVFQKKV